MALYVGEVLGLWPTVWFLLANSVVGVWLLGRDGRRVVASFREVVRNGQLPTAAILNGTAIAVGAALLITPWFLTDAAGFALLIAPSRAGIIKRGQRYLYGRF